MLHFRQVSGFFFLMFRTLSHSLESNVTLGVYIMRVGYRRVSSVDQNLDRQELNGCERIFEDKASGKNTDRIQLQEMIAYVREGDEVVVHSIDRLARDLRDLQSIITDLNDKGVSIEFLSERLVFSDNDDAFAKLQLQMMGAFAEFERNISKRRQAEGIEKAKAKGVYKGRRATVNKARIRQLLDEGLNKTEIANVMNISRMTVHRALVKQTI